MSVQPHMASQSGPEYGSDVPMTSAMIVVSTSTLDDHD